MTDQEIIDGLKNRDNDVLKYLLNRFFPMTKSAGLKLSMKMKIKITDINSETKDILQDVFELIIHAVDKDKIILNAKFSTILYGFIKISWLSRLKKLSIIAKHQKLTPLSQGKTYYPDYDDDIDEETIRNAFDYYFEKLSEKCQKMLEMSWSNLPPDLIAKKFELTYRGFITRKYKCKERLIHLIKSNPDNF